MVIIQVGAGGGAHRSHSVKRGCRKRHPVRDVLDITEEELENVALAPKDKILDKDRVSFCRPGPCSPRCR